MEIAEKRKNKKISLEVESQPLEMPEGESRGDIIKKVI